MSFEAPVPLGLCAFAPKDNLFHSRFFSHLDLLSFVPQCLPPTPQDHPHLLPHQSSVVATSVGPRLMRHGVVRTLPWSM